MKNEHIAKVCHEVNRVYCEAIGDKSQVPWEKASKQVKESACRGVEFHLENERTPEESHNAWMKDMIAAGWTYGETKNAKKKTHPCIIPYGDLPAEQKVRDSLFKAVVESMAGIEHVKKLPVKYVGLRPNCMDNVFGTLIRWNAKGETVLVPEDIAKQMISKHPDIWALGKEDEAVDVAVEESQVKSTDVTEDEDNTTLEAKDAVNAMRSKKAVMQFASTNFSNMKMDENQSLNDLKRQAIGFIDQYGIN